jgi:hypothetical protein
MGASAPIILNEEFNGSIIFALLTYFKKVALVNQSPKKKVSDMSGTGYNHRRS